MPTKKDEAPVIAFASARRWEAWLAKQHAKSGGICPHLQEGIRAPPSRMPRPSTRRSATVDRQPEEGHGRPVLAAEVRAAAYEERVVTHQPAHAERLIKADG
jgi:hypothetical protein